MISADQNKQFFFICITSHPPLIKICVFRCWFCWVFSVQLGESCGGLHSATVDEGCSGLPWEQIRLANSLGLISGLPGLNCKMNSSFCTLGLGASSKD